MSTRTSSARGAPTSATTATRPSESSPASARPTRRTASRRLERVFCRPCLPRPPLTLPPTLGESGLAACKTLALQQVPTTGELQQRCTAFVAKRTSTAGPTRYHSFAIARIRSARTCVDKTARLPSRAIEVARRDATPFCRPRCRDNVASMACFHTGLTMRLLAATCLGAAAAFAPGFKAVTARARVVVNVEG